MIMDNLEKIFDDIIKERNKEKLLKEKYFSDLHTKALGFINSAYEKLLFLNENGFKVYKSDANDMYFYIDYPYGIHTATSKITSKFVSYTYLGEKHLYPSTDKGFIVDWFNRDGADWKSYDTLEELVKVYAEKARIY